MAFLKTILIILLVYYGFKILVRMFAPKLFGYAAKKTQEHFRGKFEQYAQEGQNTEERVGNVIIDKKTSRKQAASKGEDSKKVGDYIDFEEID